MTETKNDDLENLKAALNEAYRTIEILVPDATRGERVTQEMQFGLTAASVMLQHHAVVAQALQVEAMERQTAALVAVLDYQADIGDRMINGLRAGDFTVRS